MIARDNDYLWPVESGDLYIAFAMSLQMDGYDASCRHERCEHSEVQNAWVFGVLMSIVSWTNVETTVHLVGLSEVTEWGDSRKRVMLYAYSEEKRLAYQHTRVI